MSKPKRIILIRHGESQGNVDKTVYSKFPDYAIYLTNKGKLQAGEAGMKLKEILQSESYGCYYSPYFRARQTMDLAVRVIDNDLSYNKNRFFKKEEVRIREQEYSGKLRVGRHDDDKDRDEYGKFFYRQTGGESAADVFDRVCDFIGALHRDFEKLDYPSNCLIFAHGMSNRVFIKKFLHCSVEEFETWKNPRNGEIYILELQVNNKYKLITDIQKHATGYGYQYKLA